jgi:palmitoyl transferase
LKRRLLALVIVFGLPSRALALDCADFWTWLETGCRRVVDTYDQGGNELFLSGYAYHLPSTYTPEKRAELNNDAWGGGWGRSVEDPNGDTHTVYAAAFLDSHKNVQFNLGYYYGTYWGARDRFQPGIGSTIFVMQRRDISCRVRFTAAIPLGDTLQNDADNRTFQL